MKRIACVLLVAGTVYGGSRPFDVNALLKIQRISDPQISPDGKQVAFTVQTVEVEQNTKPKQIYVVALNGGVPRKLAGKPRP